VPAAAPHWAEQWTFDAVDADGTLAVSVGVGRRALERGGGRRGWYWLVVVGRDRTCVAVVDPDVALTPGSASLEYRSPGLWADHNCSAPGGHWSVAAEAFGVALSDPWDVWGRAFGHSTAVGADLEWDPVEAVVPARGAGGLPGVGSAADSAGAWSVGCAVHGELLVGDERHELDCTGVRGHQWGSGVLGPAGWLTASWRTPGGVWCHHSDPHGAPVHPGISDGGSATAADDAPDNGIWSITVGAGTTVGVEVVSWAPVLDDAVAGGGKLVMALARFSGRSADGADCGGMGWLRYRPHQGSQP